MTNQLLFLDDLDDEADHGAEAEGPFSGDRDLGRERDGSAADWDDPNEFRLDERTRAIGRIGIAACRQALADAVRRAEAREQQLAA